MHRKLATFTSDEVNRYGYSIAMEALADAVAENWKGAPMFVSHDWHRPIGISRPMGLQLHARRALLRGEIYLPATQEEEARVERFAGQYLAQKLYTVESADKAALEAHLEDCLSTEAEFWRRECVTAIDTGIAKRKFPHLFPSDETDKRSLIPISELDEIAPGVFRIGALAVFAHRYFRRSLSQINNTNDSFLRRFFSLKDHPELMLRIALDPDSVGLASSYLSPIELEYWRGPKFLDDITKIPLGVAVHKATEKERIFHGIDRTEFFWHMQNGLRSFECEELLDRETLGIGSNTFGCRYAHSIIDEGTNLPNHLDGAIRAYEAEQFLDRIEADISKAGKKSRYVKLWRVDGPIGLASWKELISDFFRGNPLIGEYLGGSSERTIFDDRSNNSDHKKTSLLPTLLQQDGLQIAATYHHPDEVSGRSEGGFVLGHSMIKDGKPIRTIELSALDLFKLTQRALGRPIQLASGIIPVAIEDMDINHPLMLCGGDAPTAVANAWKSALIQLCEAFCARSESRFITANVGISYDDVIVKFAFAGFASMLARSLKDLPDFPEDLNGVGHWCTTTYNYLKKTPPLGNQSEDEIDLFRIDGTFRMDRPYVDPNLLSMDENETWSIRLPPQDEQVAKALSEGKLSVTHSVEINVCTCSGCGKSYLFCTCSVFVDEGIQLRCEDIGGMRMVITERPARQIPG